MLKPTGLNRGIGIHIFQTFDQLREIMSNNYGIGQYVEKLIPKACKYLMLDKKLPLHNNGTPIRNWLHARDTASAIITIIESGIKDEIYNINGDSEQSNYQTFEKIVSIYNKKNVEDCIDFSYNREGQDLRYALDDSKLRSLGWKPEANFDEELLEYQCKNRYA